MEGKSFKQIRFVPQSGVYVAVAPGVQGHLTEERAAEYVRTFSDGSWATFDDFTKMYYNILLKTIPAQKCTVALYLLHKRKGVHLCVFARIGDDERHTERTESCPSPVTGT
jgi:hypothetical protein